MSSRKAKRSSDEIKVKIMSILNDGKVYSYSMLSKKAQTSYLSIKSNMEFLESLGFVETKILTKKQTGTGKASYQAVITEKGKEWLQSRGKK